MCEISVLTSMPRFVAQKIIAIILTSGPVSSEEADPFDSPLVQDTTQDRNSRDRAWWRDRDNRNNSGDGRRNRSYDGSHRRDGCDDRSNDGGYRRGDGC